MNITQKGVSAIPFATLALVYIPEKRIGVFNVEKVGQTWFTLLFRVSLAHLETANLPMLCLPYDTLVIKAKEVVTDESKRCKQM